MKIKSHFLAIFSILSFKAFAQNENVARFTISSKQIEFDNFLKSYPEIRFLIIKYKNDRPELLEVFYQNVSSNLKPSETYYLTFEGDRFLLKKKYKKFILLESVQLDVGNLCDYGKLPDSVLERQLETKISKDSIIHNVAIHLRNTGIFHPGLDKVGRASLKGDVAILKKEINQKVEKLNQYSVQDSNLIISGIVEKNGTVTDWKLETGDATKYSKIILAFFENSDSKWRPALQGGKAVRYMIRIYLKLKNDGTVDIFIY